MQVGGAPAAARAVLVPLKNATVLDNLGLLNVTTPTTKETTMRTLLNRTTRKAGIAFVAAGILTGIVTGTANASPTAGWIGPGQNSHGVCCVQTAINA